MHGFYYIFERFYYYFFFTYMLHIYYLCARYYDFVYFLKQILFYKSFLHYKLSNTQSVIKVVLYDLMLFKIVLYSLVKISLFLAEDYAVVLLSSLTIMTSIILIYGLMQVSTISI